MQLIEWIIYTFLLSVCILNVPYFAALSYKDGFSEGETNILSTKTNGVLLWVFIKCSKIGYLLYKLITWFCKEIEKRWKMYKCKEVLIIGNYFILLLVVFCLTKCQSMTGSFIENKENIWILAELKMNIVNFLYYTVIFGLLNNHMIERKKKNEDTLNCTINESNSLVLSSVEDKVTDKIVDCFKELYNSIWNITCVWVGFKGKAILRIVSLCIMSGCVALIGVEVTLNEIWELLNELVPIEETCVSVIRLFILYIVIKITQKMIEYYIIEKYLNAQKIYSNCQRLGQKAVDDILARQKYAIENDIVIKINKDTFTDLYKTKDFVNKEQREKDNYIYINKDMPCIKFLARFVRSWNEVKLRVILEDTQAKNMTIEEFARRYLDKIDVVQWKKELDIDLTDESLYAAVRLFKKLVEVYHF